MKPLAPWNEITPGETPIGKRSSLPAAAKTWYYAGPIITDITVVICMTVALIYTVIPLDFYKWVVGALVVGNVALRMPNSRNAMPPNNMPGGGGLIMAIVGWVLSRHQS